METRLSGFPGTSCPEHPCTREPRHLATGQPLLLNTYGRESPDLPVPTSPAFLFSPHPVTWGCTFPAIPVTWFYVDLYTRSPGYRHSRISRTPVLRTSHDAYTCTSGYPRLQMYQVTYSESYRDREIAATWRPGFVDTCVPAHADI